MDTVKIQLLNNWKFNFGDESDAWFAGYDDTKWQAVVIPHDWSVTLPFSETWSSGTGYLAGGIGWYRLHFNLPKEYQNKKVRIIFDGIYKNSQIWCNSYNLGKRPNGYLPIEYDITDFIHTEDIENIISVKVVHTDLADSRWFTGSGITRKVSLLIEDRVHLLPHGTIFTTPAVTKEKASIRLSQTLINEGDKEALITLRSTLLAADASKALEMTTETKLLKGEEKEIILEGDITKPNLWSADCPSLYTLITELQVGNETFACISREKVGIREFHFDPDGGFFINGKNEKLKGVCVHHDGGCLGAAMAKEVWERRLYKLKELGCNAIRTSHNPHMPELYELCDEMGFFVIDEAFDEWENAKNKWWKGHNSYPPKNDGYAEDFPVWHQQDLMDLVKRDRNHPSVILWSIGNEIDYPNDPYCHPLFTTMTGNNDANKPEQEHIYNPQRPNTERLKAIAGRLAAIVKENDTTRPVTLAVAFPELTSQLGFFEQLDVIGYNYKEHLYAEDHQRFPDKSFMGSENVHSYEAWQAVAQNDYISGQFLWTGIDFLGEAPGWPIHGSTVGIMTMAGFEKADYFRRKSFWANKPVLYLAACDAGKAYGEEMPFSLHWNYEPGIRVYIRAYTNLPEVELCLNNKKIKAPVNQKQIREQFGYFEWEVAYEEGVLKAFAKDNELQATLETTGIKLHINAQLWQPTICVNQTEHTIHQVELALVDEAQCLVRTRDQLFTVMVSGGEIMGLENGDLADCTSYTGHSRKTNEGRLIVYVRKNGSDNVTLKVTAEDAAIEPVMIEI